MSHRHSQRGIDAQAAEFENDVTAGRSRIRGPDGQLVEPGWGSREYDTGGGSTWYKPWTWGSPSGTSGTIYEDPSYADNFKAQRDREAQLDTYKELPHRGVRAQMRGMGVGEIAGGANAAWEMAQKSPEIAGAFGFGPLPFGLGFRGGGGQSRKGIKIPPIVPPPTGRTAKPRGS